MATAHLPPEEHEDNFTLELGRIREQIKQKFGELIDYMKARESDLLEELDAILVSYFEYRNEVKNQRDKKGGLERIKQKLEEELQDSPMKGFNENLITLAENELKSVKMPAEPKMVLFVCEMNIVFEELNKLGKLVQKAKNVDYKNKVHPKVSVCEKGKGLEQLDYPCGVTIDDTTGNIYVADQWAHCVKVFDKSGKFLFKFGDSDCEGKMVYPRFTVICGDKILVSNGQYNENNNNILIYQMNGDYVSKIGKFGKDAGEFHCPHGIACNESNGDIFICDYYNNRVQILSKDFQFKSQFGTDKLEHPRDVKLSREYIYILDESNPCLHLYSYDFILRKDVIYRGKERQIVDSFCFFIYNSDGILISDRSSNSVLFFSSEFQLTHKINTSAQPMGVIVNNEGRVIVVCQAIRDCLQIF